MIAKANTTGDGPVWTAYEDVDTEFQKELRRELRKEGCPESVLSEKKDLLTGYVVNELVNKGVLDEIIDEEEDSDAESTNATMKGRRTGIHRRR